MGGIFSLLGTMNGTAFSMAAVFALGVQPYINSSIIIQLLTVAIPALERLQRDGGEEGRKKLAAITRYVTVAIALLQGFGYYTLIRTQSNGALLDTAGLPGWWAAIVIILCFTAGSAFVMWLGEQITEFGIGNGISIILFAGILSGCPPWYRPCTKASATTWTASPARLCSICPGGAHPHRHRHAGHRGAHRVHPELRAPLPGAVRQACGGPQDVWRPVQPHPPEGEHERRYAHHLCPGHCLPAATVGMFFGKSTESGGAWGTFLTIFDTTSVVYIVIYFLLIVGFSYFYSTMQFNPVEVANNLKKNGGFIPGFRPGKPTADFIHKVLGKITMFGALYWPSSPSRPSLPARSSSAASGHRRHFHHHRGRRGPGDHQGFGGSDAHAALQGLPGVRESVS